MRRFRLLYFRDSLLEGSEDLYAQDVLEAIEKASGQPADVKVEIWSEHGRAAVIAASPAIGRAQLRPPGAGMLSS